VIEKHLLDVAAQHFASAGYRQTTLDTIARHAGLSKASMYRYVENKQELLCKIFLKIGGTYSAALEPIQTASIPPAEKLRRAVRCLIRLITENVALFTVFYTEESDLPPTLRAQVIDLRQRNVAGLESILQEGIAQGVFRPLDTRLTVQAILGMCTWLHKWYRSEDERLEPIVEAFVGLIEKGCATPPEFAATHGVAHQLRHIQDALGCVVAHVERLEQRSASAKP
jgi:AcrR family transcriptional regulator